MTSPTNTAPSSSANPTQHKHSLHLVYLIVVLYALCYQLQSPIEPFLVEKILKSNDITNNSASLSATYAKLKSFFSIAQSLGSLAFGTLLDRYGVRVGLAINFLACATCYYTLSVTDSVALLYLSRVPGIAMAGFLCAQTAVIKLTVRGEERLTALGRLTTAYTVGGTVGPYLGGRLGASGDYYVGARWATAGSVLALVMVFFLPASVDKRVSPTSEGEVKEDKVSGTNKNCDQQRWRDRIVVLWKSVGGYLAVKMVTSVANSMARSSQPLILKALGADEATMGNIMSVQFAFGGFANGFLLAPITSLLGGRVSSVVRNCFVSMGFIYLFQAVLFSSYGGHNLIDSLENRTGLGEQHCFVAIALLLSLLQYSLGTSITAETSTIVAKSMQGTLMGCEHSIFAVASMIGPTVGVTMLEYGGISGLSVSCACVFGTSWVFWNAFGERMKP